MKNSSRKAAGRMNRRLKMLEIGSDDPEFSPLMNLNRDVMLSILNQLPYRDFISLALTCHKWYNCAVEAPSVVKPIASFHQLTLNEVCLSSDQWTVKSKTVLYDYLENEDGSGIWTRSKPKHKRWTMDAPLTPLIKEIKCDALTVKYSSRNNCVRDVQRFYVNAAKYLTQNRDRYKIKQLELFYPFCGLDKDVLQDLFKSSPRIMVSFDDFSLVPSSGVLISNLIKAMWEYKDYQEMLCYIPFSLPTYQTIVTQYARGERPNLSHVAFIIRREGFRWNRSSMDEFYMFLETRRNLVSSSVVKELSTSRKVRTSSHRFGQASLVNIWTMD